MNYIAQCLRCKAYCAVVAEDKKGCGKIVRQWIDQGLVVQRCDTAFVKVNFSGCVCDKTTAKDFGQQLTLFGSKAR